MAVRLGRAALAVAVIVAAISLAPGGCFPVQNALLYFPARAPLGELTAAGLQAWPGPGDFRGLLAEPRGAARGTLVLFHGNAGHAGHRGFYAGALQPASLRVILAEYPGYGPRGGQLGEASLVQDARSTLSRAYAQFGAPLVVAGESLGAAVAAEAAAAERDKVASLWLITPWDRLASVAKHHYPWAPVGLLLRDEYDSATHLGSFDRPVLVDIAELDEIVPGRFGRRLYDSLRSSKRLRVVPGAGHNDWPLTIADSWWPEAIEFLLDGPVTREK